ncbi:hypothetical protein F5Y19DRAFT_153220 [Xylariaceae sp. FL1651]|nr:hypothetical protein F5Y19DRAFT_153220 [Xylariaceae sp. FL1651]
MAEVFGVAASALAVVELSAKAAISCLQYSKDVRHAKEDIARVHKEVTNLHTVVEGVQQLLNSPQGAQLSASQTLYDVLEDVRTELKILEYKLYPGKTRKTIRRFGVPALKWPFEKRDVDTMIQVFTQYAQTISLSLQVDQTTTLLAIDQRIVSTNQKTVLDKLPFAAGAAFDSHAEEHNPTCLQDTRVDILRQIYEWAEDSDGKDVFWLNGVAGTGKSTISHTIARSFSKSGQLGASFFFKKGEGDRGSISRFFTTITAQLVQKQPALASHVKNVIDADPGIFQKAMREQFEKLILGPLSKIMQHTQNSGILIVVIDALDECERHEDVKLVIDLLCHVDMPRSSQLRIFITSRPELPIRLGFHDAKGKYQCLILHEIAESAIEHDITTFFKHELVKIRHSHNKTVTFKDGQLPPTWPEESKIRTLVKMAVPLFIFAATICRFVSDPAWCDPASQLEKMLAYENKNFDSELDKIDATYRPIFDQLLIGKLGLARQRLIEAFCEIIGPIVLLAQPQSAQSLARLLNTEPEAILNRLNSLHSVINVPPGADIPIRLYHKSLHDFLVDPQRRDGCPFWIDEKITHKRLATNCLRLMNEHLRADICAIQWPGTRRSAISSQRINTYLPPELQYACQYWVYHTQQAGDRVYDGDQVHGFLKQHFLHWLEALALIGQFSKSFQLKSLQALLNDENSIELSEFLADALRFIPTSRPAIQHAPLQIYCSALAFAPKKSTIRNIFYNEIPGWMSLKPKADTHWNTCIQTLADYQSSVYSVVFSPDSKLMASGSTDHTVRIWSVDTGATQQTLKGHGGTVSSVAFSPDGKFVASGSDDKTVWLWSVDMGTPQQIFKGHNSFVTSVAFSPDGKFIVSGSHDKTARLWSTDKNALHQTFEGHTDRVNSVAFSPNGKLVASGSGDMTIRLWSTITSAPQRILSSTDQVTSVAFSPDSQVVAVGTSHDSTIQLWSVGTGTLQKTITGHSGYINSVAFSPDGKLVASGSWDRTVRLWSATTGALQQTLYHNGWVGTVVFSPDARLVASADSDCIRLWSTATSTPQQTLSRTDPIDLLTISPDGKLVVSVSYDRTVQLWSAVTGALQHTLIHADLVNTVAFSSDGRLIALCSFSTEVWLCSAATGEFLQTVEHESLYFYPNGHFTYTDATSLASLPGPSITTLDTKRTSAMSASRLLLNHDREQRSAYGISNDRRWLTLSGENLLWLSEDAKPWCSAVSGSTVAIGTELGKVIIMRFSTEWLRTI